MNLPAARTQTANILCALGIKKLYWIDDKFHDPGEADYDTLVFATSNAIADAISVGRPITECIPGLPEGSYAGLQPSEVSSFARRHLEEANLTVLDLKELLAKLDALPDDVDKSELAEGQFSTFEQLLKTGGADVIKLSFGKWQESKAELASNREVLYLVDYENTREGNGITGDDVLQHLASLDSSPFSIVFTHVCEPDSEQEKAGQFQRQITGRNVGPYRAFSVMSKKRLQNEQQLDLLDKIVAPPLKRLAIGHTYRQVAATCIDGYRKGAVAAVDELDAMPVSDIYRAIFERTWEEGASEVEVVCRIINAAQRKGVFDEIVAATKTKDSNFFPALTALRSVSNVGIASEPAQIDPYIAALHQAEVFDSEIINRMHLPLSCGDLFQKTINGKPEGPIYILLAPPCDLMVRTDSADRNAKEGTFVLLREKPREDANVGEKRADEKPMEENASAEQRAIKKYDITKQNGNVLFADFHQPFTVNLSVLDYCVWNPSGEVKFNRKNPPRASGMLLEGWIKRLQELSKEVSGAFSQEYRALCFVGGPAEFRERDDPQNGEISFPLKRIARLRSPYAEAVFNEYLASLGRPAFDHSLVD